MGVQQLIPGVDAVSSLQQDVAITVLRLACLAFCFWLGRQRYSREVFFNLPGRPGLSWILGAWLFLAFGVSCFVQAYAPLTAWNAGSRLLELLIALVVAANEEVGWRTTLFLPLQELFGNLWAVGLTSLFFTLMHAGYQPWQAWPRIVFTALLFSFARLRGVSLRALIFIHFACDAVSALYQGEGAFTGGWTLTWISSGLVGATAVAVYFVKPRPKGA
jgi:membrane protease YdiL (CAAX protease family)